MLVEKTVTGMAKYIDREALVEWLKRIPLKDLSDGRGLCRVIFEDDFKRAIKKIPKGIIADVSTVRHGRWIEQEKYTFGTMYDCSICGNRILDNGHPWNYCPNCGARINIEEFYDCSYHTKYGNVRLDYCPNCGAKMYGGED